MSDNQRLRKQTVPFTQIANDVANLNTISWKAKGVYLYLASKPDGWKFYVSEIAKNSSCGLTATKSAIKELEQAGLLVRKRTRGEDGLFSGFEYTLNNHPTTNHINHQAENPTGGETPLVGKSATSNSNNNNNNNKDSNTNKHSVRDEQFESFWVAYGRKGNKKTAKDRFRKLTDMQVEEIRANLPAYLFSTKNNLRYRKDAQVYLNPEKEHWNDTVFIEQTAGSDSIEW